MAADPLPPGPRRPGVLQSLAMVRDPYGFFERCHARFGDMFTVTAPPWGKLVYVADPAIVKEIFAGDATTWHAGAANAYMAPIVGHGSLLLLDEEDHARERRLLLPAFHGDRLKRMTVWITQLAEEELARWPHGVAFALLPRLQGLALRVVLRAVLGDAEAARTDEIGRLVDHLCNRSTLSIALSALPFDLGPRGPWGDTRRTLDAIDRLLHEEIAARRGLPARDGTVHSDVLSMLVAARYEDGGALDDRALRDHLVTLLLAGHFTTGATLAWVFERLVRHPDAMASLRADLERGGDTWLDACIKETMRVRACITDVTRKLAKPVELGGWALPVGTQICPSIVLLHRRPELYPDPLAFRPERFLDGAPDPSAWIPFGGGSRRCIGAGLALHEMRTILRTMVPRVTLRPTVAAAEAGRLQMLAVQPSSGASVVMEPAA